MENADTLWLSICHGGDFVEKNDGGWTWRPSENGPARANHVIVSKSISYIELYNKVQETIGVDSTLHEIEMRSLVPGMSMFPLAPTKIDCDNNVQWYLSVSKEVPLCVSLRPKSFHENSGSGSLGEYGVDVNTSSLLVHSEEGVELTETTKTTMEFEQVCTGEHVEEESTERIHFDWDSLDVIPTGLETQDLATAVEIQDLAIGVETQDLAESIVTQAAIDDPKEHESVALTNTYSPTLDVAPQLPGPAVRILESDDFQVKQIYSTKSVLVQKLQLLAVKCQFEYNVKKSCKWRYEVTCRSEKCEWRLRATKFINSEMFQVRIYTRQHSCSMTIHNRDHRHASYMLIGEHISSKFEDGNIVYRPKNIINDVRRDYGITLSYRKAYMAKDYAHGLVRGTPKESFAKLPSYCHVLEQKNPGTLTCIEVDDDQHFKYLFISLGQSIHGFQSSIRPVISVDGSFLTSKYGGTLIVATCQDANRQIYPLAWAVVDSENTDAYTWFFFKLRLITGDTDELVFISDRANCIPAALRNVYHFAHHGNCRWHLESNLKSRFPKADVVELFRLAAEAYTIADFDKNFAALCGKDEDIEDYLTTDVPVQFWSRAHFGGVRYNIMTTNNSESVNSALKGARDHTILVLIKHIRQMLQQWYSDRHVEAERCGSCLTPPMEEIMYYKYNKSKTYEVIPISPNEFQVGRHLEIHVVNLLELTCSCRKFDLDKFPCSHAIAAARHNGMDGYSFCSHFYTTSYWRQSYSQFIYPVPSNEDEWQIPDNVKSRVVLPPVKRRKSGRPATKRKLSAGETRKKRKCSRCRQTGHNRATCPKSIPSSEIRAE